MSRARANSQRSVWLATTSVAAGLNCSTFAVDHDVIAIKHAFDPSELVVAPGDTINWIWIEGGHTVTSGSNCIPDGEYFNAPLSRRDVTFSFTVPDDFEGEIPYFCLPHCDVGMVGLIIVAPATNPADIAPPGGDGVVGAADLAALLANWGRCPAGDECIADIDPPGGDDLVGPSDLAALLANWTQ